MPRGPRPTNQRYSVPRLTWPDNTDVLALVLELQPEQDCSVYPQYTIALHAWFLQQIQTIDPTLSAYFHDGQSEKPFTLSGLNQAFTYHRSLKLKADQIYQWKITVLSQAGVQGLKEWLRNPPETLEIRQSVFQIRKWAIAHPPMTYEQLLQTPIPNPPTLTLSFDSPTSFRRRGQHLPLPWPPNLFHSYLRRWNDFSGHLVDQDEFVDWIDDSVLILRHHLQSTQVVAGKRGSVIGFTGSMELGLSRTAPDDPEFKQLFFALGRFAPYCGTGHKTTFGLGQTSLGWSDPWPVQTPSLQDVLAQRINELTERFMAQRKRLGGDRATNIAETWATALARRELGESLPDIAADMDLNYETVKTYVKLARRALKEEQAGD